VLLHAFDMLLAYS